MAGPARKAKGALWKVYLERVLDEAKIEHVKLCCTGVCAEMKTNITLKIDADLLREARILAAEEGSSLSAMVAVRLEEVVRERKGYRQARRRALARLREGLDLHWTPAASRDELHER